MIFGKLTKYQIYLTGTVLVLAILAVGLSIANLNRHPVVLGVTTLAQGDAKTISPVNTVLQVRFSQLMDRASVESGLQISPAQKYRTSWSTNSLVITFENNLESATAYTLRIAGSVQNIYGLGLIEDFQYKFSTIAPQFTYIEHSAEDKDTIINYDILSNVRTELVSTAKIEQFSQKTNSLAFATSPLVGGELYLRDLNSQTQTKIDLGPGLWRVDKLIFAPGVKQELAIAADQVELSGEIVIPQSNSQLFLYDIPNRQLKLVEGHAPLELIYTPDGDGILYRSEDAVYYLLDLQTNDVTDLGRHLSTGGFSKDRNKVLFVDYDLANPEVKYPNINVYNDSRQSVSLTDGTEFDADPQYFHLDTSIAFAAQFAELEGTRGLFGIKVLNPNKKQLLFIKQPGKSLEFPKVSPDDRYLVIEQYTPDQLLDYTNMRNYVYATRPYDATLRVYDLQTRQFLPIDLEGVEAEWVY